MKSLKHIALIIALFLNCFSVTISLAQLHYQFTRYTQEEGLVSSSVTQIVKDKTGFLWLMSENGIMRFDGYEFKIFRNNPNNPVTIPASGFYELKVDEYGNMLVRTTQSLCKYFASTASFKKIILYSDSVHIFDWVPGAHSLVWATSANHLLCVNGQTESYNKYALPASFDRNVMRLETDKKKYVWIFNQKNQLLCFDIPQEKLVPISVYNVGDNSVQLKNAPLIFFNDPSGNTYTKTL